MAREKARVEGSAVIGAIRFDS